MKQAKFRINGVILAGGKGARMQYSEKPLLQLGGRRVIDWILQSATPQVEKLVLNVNRMTPEYASLNLPVVPDASSRIGGPLAGIHAAMLWNLANDPLCSHVACFPGDVPWFDSHFVEDLNRLMAQENSSIGWLQTQLQRQPLFSLWDIRLAPVLAEALQAGQYSPMSFIQSQSNSRLLYTAPSYRHYQNLNTPEDLARARALALDLP